MGVLQKPKLALRDEARDFIDLYIALGPKAENILPRHIADQLSTFYYLCHQEPDDPVLQLAEINRRLLTLKEEIPGYSDVSLMLFPHEESKAYEYRTQRNRFRKKLTALIDAEAMDESEQEQIQNVLNGHDYSVGTPPVTQNNLDFRYEILLGDKVTELRKYREILGITNSVQSAQWNYLLDVFDQMIVQSSHYTTSSENADFLNRMDQTIRFRGFQGLANTVVSGSTDTTIMLIKKELFNKDLVEDVVFTSEEELYIQMQQNTTAIFAVRIERMRSNVFGDIKWFPMLSRIIFVEDSDISRQTNTTLVFCLHNKIIATLNNVHTKKLGAAANSQLNLRLILEKVSLSHLHLFKERLEQKISDYAIELEQMKLEQLGETLNPAKDIVLFKFDEFSRQILKDKYSLEKLRDYIELVINVTEPVTFKKQNKYLVQEFEERTKKYFYSGNDKLHIATVTEGGGRNQIRTYGEYLLQRKLKPVESAIIEKCRIILNIIPDSYTRTLQNHFHKNFGINLFLEKYKQYLIKAENEADNKGRFKNFLIDLGIHEKYDALSENHKEIVKEFLSALANLEKTSIRDDVQMIIRDVLFGKEDKVLRPYILFNKKSSWEYLDLFPTDRFDINPFDLEIGITPEGRIDYAGLTEHLSRMKNTFQLFDDSGNLWDSFCENLTIVINDPANPSGYSDFNNLQLLDFLRFISSTKITLFLDEAYNDSVKNVSDEEPKWRTISRYIMNNLTQQYARIHIVSSISTTKNLGATGDRLGSLIATPAKKDFIDFARKQNNGESGNTNSLFILVNMLENAHLAKNIKDDLEEKLPRNASRSKIKSRIEQYIVSEVESYRKKQQNKNSKELLRFSPFEGSPLHLFLLNELVALDKLDVLRLPDDFMYRNEPFFAYYQKQLVSNINKFRVNKNFRNEALLRLNMAKKVATELLSGDLGQYASVVASDGSYLFNLQLRNFFSYQDLEKFTKKLAANRGIAVIPYQTGFLRFSLGDYLDGTDKGYDAFRKDFRNALEIVLKYWVRFHDAKNLLENKEKGTDQILDTIFATESDRAFVKQLLKDYYQVKNIKKTPNQSLKINTTWTMYHPAPAASGVGIHAIEGSSNAVIEFTGEVGKCSSLPQFIRSLAFSAIYENLLPQVYKKIPAIKHLDMATVYDKYGKPKLLKYITNKLEYQPTNYVLDAPGEEVVMAEILLEMEKLLFSPAKSKILAIETAGSAQTDVAHLEGTNMLLRKYIRELMLHFNLPFEQQSLEPSLRELCYKTAEKFTWLSGKSLDEMNFDLPIMQLMRDFERKLKELGYPKLNKWLFAVETNLRNHILQSDIDSREKWTRLYLATRQKDMRNQILEMLMQWQNKISILDDTEREIMAADFVQNILPEEIQRFIQLFLYRAESKVSAALLHSEIRKATLLLINSMNRTKNNEHYDAYTHSVIRLTEAEFAQQNSAINEMVQHGISLHSKLDTSANPLESYNNGELKWISDMMKTCGVIAVEQNVQTHTRIATDAKKREYPFHRIDRKVFDPAKAAIQKNIALSEKNSNEYIKILDTRPLGTFFFERVKKYVLSMDTGDYRVKIFNGGLLNEMFIFHKSYLKYLTDNFRLLDYYPTTAEDAANFVPDTMIFYGAPEKVISFPQIGYFDIQGPNGIIKTFLTPLKKKVDYFGDIKKPRLTIMNEKVKDMGGIPVHGSMFAVEEEDGALFVVQIAGDSGVGKSEMLAAMMLKWMKKNLPGVRSLKMIAGDMFHVFPDKAGNLYGIGTEVGDFSRVTDFDPDYIKYYYSLFQSAADSNVEDLNSRSTISGLCDVRMPYKIDIMLTATNFAREEAGIVRYQNPENFILYRNSHGERKEKATSGDNPHFQRTLMRYSNDKNIVELLDKHGSYLDDVLDWLQDEKNGKIYLASSYKTIDKVDPEEITQAIFGGKSIIFQEQRYTIDKVRFDIIDNRFTATAVNAENEIQVLIDRALFNQLFNALASTPAGQPFVDEINEMDGKLALVELLKTGDGKKIQLGILSTDIGRKGKEITGPQIAAEDMRKLIREVRIARPEINENKNKVIQWVRMHYAAVFNGTKVNSEIFRYNFWLWQMEQMRKARFVRIDDASKTVDLSRLKGFKQEAEDKIFSPLLLTPNMHMELSSFGETYLQLMDIPNNKELQEEFEALENLIYFAENYSKDTIIHNVVLQLLILQGYLLNDDLTKGSLNEKINREILAAALCAANSMYDKRLDDKADESKHQTKKKK